MLALQPIHTYSLLLSLDLISSSDSTLTPSTTLSFIPSWCNFTMKTYLGYVLFLNHKCTACYLDSMLFRHDLTWTPQRIDVVLSRGRCETLDSSIQMSLRLLSKQTWASITAQQNHRLITSMPRLNDEMFCSKVSQTKYCVHKLTYFSYGRHFCIIYLFCAMNETGI